MATPVTYVGNQYSVPAYNDTGYAQGAGNLSSYLVALATGCLTLSGGSFPLTAETDFGSNFGLKALYLKTETANPASAGVVRLAKTDSIAWRNNANGADKLLSIDVSDNLQYAATKILLSGAVVNADINASAAIAYSKLALTGSILNADISASAAIAVSKLASLGGSTNAVVTQNSSGIIQASAILSSNLLLADGSVTMTGNLAFDTTHGVTGANGTTDATTGNVGQNLSSSAINVSAFGNATWGDVTNVSLTAGRWLVFGQVTCILNGATQTAFNMGVSSVTGNSTPAGNLGDDHLNCLPPNSSAQSSGTVAGFYVKVSATTIYYLKAVANYSGGTPQFSGRISAMRIS